MVGDEAIVSPRLVWVIAGKNGLEIHGMRSSNPSKMVVRVRTHPLHWDFSFKNVEGSGRVRVGAGCAYNPLQMVEAMWNHIANDMPPAEAMSFLTNPEPDDVEIITFDTTATHDEWNEFMLGDDGDDWV